MASNIQFTDSIGSATLASSWPTPFDRFRNWVPSSTPIGERAHSMADGRRYQFQFREDHGVRFEIAGIRNTDADIALRLMSHLIGGGLVTVNTGDASSRSYASCGIAPETEPELTLEDRQLLEYSFALSLINVATSPTPMLCEY